MRSYYGGGSAMDKASARSLRTATAATKGKVKVVNKSTTKSGEELAPQDIDIDGEAIEFLNFVKYECLKHELELIVDFDHIINPTYLKS